jgi:hypothetical protein
VSVTVCARPRARGPKRPHAPSLRSTCSMGRERRRAATRCRAGVREVRARRRARVRLMPCG